MRRLALVSSWERIRGVCRGRKDTLTPYLSQLFDMAGGGNDGAHFPALVVIACWRRKRCLHFVDVFAIG